MGAVDFREALFVAQGGEDGGRSLTPEEAVVKDAFEEPVEPEAHAGLVGGEEALAEGSWEAAHAECHEGVLPVVDAALRKLGAEARAVALQEEEEEEDLFGALRPWTLMRSG